MASGPHHEFDELFRAYSARVRRRFALSRILTGAGAGLAVGALASAASWYLRFEPGRLGALVFGAAGVFAGLYWASRRRLSDRDVALFLDARLGSDETVATALELAGPDASSGSARAVVGQALEVLRRHRPKAVRARWLSRTHALVPVAIAALVYVSWIPMPAAPAAPPPPPGVDTVQIEELEELDKIIELTNVEPRDDAQKERLEDIARQAEELKKKLSEGTERREALSELARLRDAIMAERLSMGSGENRKGLEAAVSELSTDAQMRDAARALGDRDMVRFDEEMQRLAAEEEDKARQRAKELLEQAKKAAEEEGAEDVAKALEEQQERFEEQEEKAEALRDLAEQMGEGLSEEGKQALENFNQNPTPEAQKQLAESLGDALKDMDPEQRKQLAENLKKMAEDMANQPPGDPSNPGQSNPQLEDLAEKLQTEQGQQALKEMLEQMAQPPDTSGEGQRQQALGEAEKQLGEAQKQLGMPTPMPGANPGSGGPKPPSGGQNPGDQGKPPGSGSDPSGDPAGGDTPGGGKGPGEGGHDGETGKIDGGKLNAHAPSPVLPGAPMPGVSDGRAPGVAGDSASIEGSGALGAAGPGEVSALNRSDVPQEYREQVGRYFDAK